MTQDTNLSNWHFVNVHAFIHPTTQTVFFIKTGLPLFTVEARDGDYGLNWPIEYEIIGM